MRPIFQVKQGFVQKSKEKLLGAFDLNRFVKWMLKELNVPSFDKCCDSDSDISPVRVNSGSIETIQNGEWEQFDIDMSNVDNLQDVLGYKVTRVDTFPSGPTAAGGVGDIAFNATHGAFCVAMNTWVRWELDATWV